MEAADQRIRSVRVIRFLPELLDRPDVMIGPDEGTWARRVLPSTSPLPFVDWYPLVGAGRSRVSESDGVAFYGRSY